MTTCVMIVPAEPDGSRFSEPCRNECRRLLASVSGAESAIKIVSEPDAADIILFAGSISPYQRTVRRHPLARLYPGKVFVFDLTDRPIPFMRGVYACLDKGIQHPTWTRSGFYSRVIDGTDIEPSPLPSNPRYLASFLGDCRNAGIRGEMLSISRGDILIHDSGSGEPCEVNGCRYAPDQARRAFLNSLSCSRFVLCPRGRGVSSWRIFEVMRAGRCPVIMSDGWIQSEGPCWEEFALFVPERRVYDLPRLLASCRDEAADRGKKARCAWERHFGPRAALGTVVSLCKSLLSVGSAKRSPPLSILLRCMEPHHLRHALFAQVKETVLLDR